MQKYKKLLIVIAGPTAVGKTSLSIELAKKLHTEIVSTDSRQFFKEMNIGTAKPTSKELRAVPHHLINFLSIQQDYDVKEFEQDALLTVNKIFNNSDIAVATGGSGLYIKTLCEGIDEMPEIKPEIREKLNRRLELEGLSPLTEELKKYDPEYFNEVDLKNPRRVIRALEVYLETGKPISTFRKNLRKNESPRDFAILKIGLKRNREELYDRINLRVDQMLQEGLLEEAQSLWAFKNKNALQTVGYQEIFSYLKNEYDWDEAVRLIKRNTRRFAKRQLTWFKKDPEMHWFSLSENMENDLNQIFEFIREKAVEGGFSIGR